MLRYLLPALAIARSASAVCSTATTTIQNSGDASALATCSTFSGTIAIATNAAGDLAFDGIQKLDGSIIAKNVDGLTSISGNDMQEITGDFILTEDTNVQTLNFPQLTNVDTIQWISVPNLAGLSFTSSVTQASEVNIQNSGLSSLDGIDLTTVDTVYLANNGFLKTVNLQVTNITNQFVVEANGDPLVVTLPNLEWAQNMTFRNCSAVEIPSLATAGGIGFYSGSLQSVSAPNITSVNGSLTLADNNDLTNITFPQLVTVQGGLSIQNNTALEEINGFPKLETVKGALDFYGNFSSVTLPSLQDVAGAFNIQSTGDVKSDCDHFQGETGANDVIKGKFSCYYEVANPGGAGTTPTGSAAGSSSTGGTGAAGHLDVSSSAVMGLAGVIAAVFGLL